MRSYVRLTLFGSALASLLLSSWAFAAGPGAALAAPPAAPAAPPADAPPVIPAQAPTAEPSGIAAVPADPNATPAPLPAPEAAPAAAPGADAEDAAQLAQLLGGDSGSSNAAAESAIRFYGFADFNLQKFMLTEKWKGIFSDHPSFYLGHLNLYIDSKISENWKSLAEVRFMFLPNGGVSGSSMNNPLSSTGRFDATVGDPTDLNRVTAWGAIAIQRAYLEYSFSSSLSVRMGRFLTPWGIWNVDHGSPVIIGPSKPYVIGEGFFPEAQTGLEFFGSSPVGDHTIGYHLTVSNGRGPTEAIQDLDSNKAIGGRLFFRTFVLGQIDVGTSAYYGTVTDERQQVNAATRGLEPFIYSKYQEVAYAADVRWMLKSFIFQSEFAVHDRVWDNRYRPTITAQDGSSSGGQTDIRRVGAYVLAGYRFDLMNVMPYLLYSYYDLGVATLGTPGKINTGSAGLNFRVTPSVVLKLEYSFAKFMGDAPATSAARDILHVFQTQIAWAF